MEELLSFLGNANEVSSRKEFRKPGNDWTSIPLYSQSQTPVRSLDIVPLTPKSIRRKMTLTFDLSSLPPPVSAAAVASHHLKPRSLGLKPDLGIRIFLPLGFSLFPLPLKALACLFLQTQM